MDISELGDFTPQVYFMNPETDDVLPDGTHLKEGMIVLIEYDNHREDTKAENVWTPLERKRAMRYNRWCLVTNVELLPEAGMVRFVAVYADGFKAQRTHSVEAAWLVKLESLEDIENGPEGM